jgi:hypothetical protein
MEDEYYKKKLEDYIEMGAIEIAGMDKEGEIIFQIMEIAKDIAPELWQSHEDWVNAALLEMFEADLISIEYDENLEATINLSEEGYEIARDYGLIPLGDDDINLGGWDE